MQRILCHQRTEAAVKPGHALLATDGVEAVGDPVVLRVDGKDQLAATIPHSDPVGGVDDGACALQAEAVQRRLQWEQHDVGHQRPRPHCRQLGEVGVQRVVRVRPLLPAPLVQPQHHPLDWHRDGVPQDGVKRGRKQQWAERKQAAAMGSADTQETRQALTDTIQQARGRVVTDDVTLWWEIQMSN